MVVAATPHYRLFCQTSLLPDPAWSFVLQHTGGPERIEAWDIEPGVDGARLELLALVRGLEALDRPARISLTTASDYVRRGLMFGMEDWRQSDWRWESFGLMVPIKNSDLWRRVDRALEFHDLDLSDIRVDRPQTCSSDVRRSAVPPPKFLARRRRRPAIRVHRLASPAVPL